MKEVSENILSSIRALEEALDASGGGSDTLAEIRGAIESLQFAPTLKGWRGQPAADLGALVSVVLKVQEFVLAHRDTLHELDINPVIAGSTGACAVDAMVWLSKRNET